MMFFTAAPQVRRGAWEVFYNTHMLFFIPSIVLVSIHSKLCLFCAIPGVALWLFDNMLSKCNRFKYVAIDPELVAPELHVCLTHNPLLTHSQPHLTLLCLLVPFRYSTKAASVKPLGKGATKVCVNPERPGA